MSVGIIIQARLSSTRLPKKVLLPLGKKSVLDHVIDRVTLAKKKDLLIVATSDDISDDPLETFLEKKAVKYFRGSLLNVLERYYLCAKKYNLERIVRVTADCPFIDPEILDRLIELSFQSNADYTGMSENGQKSFPHGVDAEVIKFSALEKAYREATKDHDKEHVCPYFYETKKEEFRLSYLNAHKKERDPSIRITLDTLDDYKACKELLKYLPKEYNTKDIVAIYKNNPYLKEINRV